MVEEISFYGPPDPFANESEEICEKIHLRVQQRNGRKCITTVEGLDSLDIDLKKILKRFKKRFSCNGAIQESEKKKKILQLSGDQRKGISDFLSKNEISKQEDIVVHGV